VPLDAQVTVVLTPPTVTVTTVFGPLRLVSRLSWFYCHSISPNTYYKHTRQ